MDSPGNILTPQEMASPFCGKDFCMFVVDETNNVNPWVAWISGKNTGCSQFYNVLQWFTLSLCCSHMFEKALMIGFLSFAFKFSLPVQSHVFHSQSHPWNLSWGVERLNHFPSIWLPFAPQLPSTNMKKWGFRCADKKIWGFRQCHPNAQVRLNGCGMLWLLIKIYDIQKET